jgi:hypothetical protein
MANETCTVNGREVPDPRPGLALIQAELRANGTRLARGVYYSASDACACTIGLANYALTRAEEGECGLDSFSASPFTYYGSSYAAYGLTPEVRNALIDNNDLGGLGGREITDETPEARGARVDAQLTEWLQDPTPLLERAYAMPQ